MIFASYTAFKVAVRQLIEGDDLATNTFSNDTLDLMIGLAENRVYRDLRASTMSLPMTMTVTANSAPLPADLIALDEIYATADSTKPFEIIPLERLRKFSASPTGTTIYAAQNNDTLIFWPTQSGTVSGNYFARPVELKSIVWANATTLARYPEVFIYASLVEAMPFLGEDARVTLWETRYHVALKNATHDEKMRAYEGSRMTVRKH